VCSTTRRTPSISTSRLDLRPGSNLCRAGVGSYTIGQVAERSGFTATALRYYEGIGLVPPAGRSDAGYRLYDDRTLSRLAFITRAKQLGCSLEEITDLVEVWDGERCAPVQRRLHELVTAKLHDADRQLTELSVFAGQLRAAAAELAGEPVDGPCDDGWASMTAPRERRWPWAGAPTIPRSPARSVRGDAGPADGMGPVVAPRDQAIGVAVGWVARRVRRAHRGGRARPTGGGRAGLLRVLPVRDHRRRPRCRPRGRRPRPTRWTWSRACSGAGDAIRRRRRATSPRRGIPVGRQLVAVGRVGAPASDDEGGGLMGGANR
jgi:DNA-binding transcriptional MerR regulator